MIKVESLTKSFGNCMAVNKVSFEANNGEILGLLGPNGSGKSTLLRILATYLLPQSGRALVAGLDIARQEYAVKQILGYLPENNILYEPMRVDKFLAFVGEAKGLRGSRLKDRFAWCVETCDLKDLLAKRCGDCSRGMRQRVAFAAALFNDPKVILLDEPTAGLDPIQSASLRERIKSMAEGRTVIFSSHVFSEVADVTDRVLIMHEGHLLSDSRLPPGPNRPQRLERLFLSTVRSKEGRP